MEISSPLTRTRSWLCGLLVLAGLTTGPAAEPILITSNTKQFIIRGRPQHSRLVTQTNPETVFVDPSLLAMAAENVKRSLGRELGWGERWRGTIYVNIHPSRGEPWRPELEVVQAGPGRNVRVQMPESVDRTQLFEAVIGALLLEYSHREATGDSVELPPWLVPGLTAHLLDGPLGHLALEARDLSELRQSPQAFLMHTSRPADTNALARQEVQSRGALTVDELNWPPMESQDGPAGENYRQSAKLFVRGLLRLKGGPEALRALLTALPDTLNWQTAFLRGYRDHFTRMLDVEKWWALSVVQFQTHDSAVQWSAREAQQKFEEVLFTPMQVQLSKDELPHLTPVALTTVITEWDFKRQGPLLRGKIQQLQAMRLRLPPELSPVAESYRSTLQRYLTERSTARNAALARMATQEALRQLQALDEERARKTAQLPANYTGPITNGVVPLTVP